MGVAWGAREPAAALLNLVQETEEQSDLRSPPSRRSSLSGPRSPAGKLEVTYEVPSAPGIPP